MNLWLLGLVLGVAILFGIVKWRMNKGLRVLIGAVLVFMAASNLGYLDGLGEFSPTVAGGLDKFYISDPEINNTDATTSTLSNGDTSVDIYVPDADIADGEDIEVDLVMERSNIGEDEAVEVCCDLSGYTFSKSGTNYQLVEYDTNNDVDATLDDGAGGAAGGTQSGDSVCRHISFAESTVTRTVNFVFDQEETGHDQLGTKESVSATCSAGGKSVTINLVENG